MGTYLYIGFIAQANTDMLDDIPTDALLKKIKKYYPADTYDIVEADGSIHFSLKPDIVREELSAFVCQVYKDYYGKISEGWHENIHDFIQSCVEDSDWLEKAREAERDDFLPDDDACGESWKVGGKIIFLNTTVVILGSEGKFLMEESENTLRFMENCARRAYRGFRLGKSFRVFLD